MSKKNRRKDPELNLSNTPIKDINISPDYADFYSAVDKYYVQPSVDQMYPENRFKSPLLLGAFEGVTKKPGPISEEEFLANQPPKRFSPMGVQAGNSQRHLSLMGVGGPNPFNNTINMSTNPFQNNRDVALYKYVQAANPWLKEGDFETYWNKSIQGQQSILDRMPTYGGVNYASAYESGLDPTEFKSKYPNITGLSVSGLNQGAGVGLGSSSATTTLGAPPTLALGSNQVSTESSLDAAPTPTGYSPGLSTSFPTPPGVANITPGAGIDSPNSLNRLPTMNGPGYATGGVVGSPPNGSPGLQPAAGTQQLTPEMADMQMKNLLAKRPEMSVAVKQAVQEAMDSGEFSPEQANTIAQLAQATLNNPALWPQLRAWAIKQGLATEQDIPVQYDQGLVLAVLLAARAYIAEESGAPGMQQGMMARQNFAEGGQILGPGTGTSDSILAANKSTGTPVKVSNGEYIVPAHVVAAKGTDFFDNLVNKYSEEQQNGATNPA